MHGLITSSPDAGAPRVEAAFKSSGKPDAADAFARLDRAMGQRVSQIRAMHREACLATEALGAAQGAPVRDAADALGRD